MLITSMSPRGAAQQPPTTLAGTAVRLRSVLQLPFLGLYPGPAAQMEACSSPSWSAAAGVLKQMTNTPLLSQCMAHASHPSGHLSLWAGHLGTALITYSPHASRGMGKQNRGLLLLLRNPEVGLSPRPCHYIPPGTRQEPLHSLLQVSTEPETAQVPSLPRQMLRARCHLSCEGLMAMHGGHAAPGKVPGSHAHPRLCRLQHHGDPLVSRCRGLRVTVTPASTFISAPLCKSCVCCHFRGPQQRLMRRVHFPLRVLCHDGAGESCFQQVWAACQGSRACRGSWGASGEHPQDWGAAGGRVGEGKEKKSNDRGNRFIIFLQSTRAQPQGVF